MWYGFGFVLCTNEYHKGDLGVLYSKLVGGRKIFRDYDKNLGIVFNNTPSSPTCSFDEFWRAWQNGRITQLFDKNGISYESGRTRGFWLEQKNRGS